MNFATLKPRRSRIFSSVFLAAALCAQTLARAQPAATSQTTPIDVTQSPGADLGAKINAAAAAHPNAKLYIPPSPTCYAYTTPIVIPNPQWLTGAGSGATCITFNPPTATGAALTFATGGVYGKTYGIEGIQLLGPGPTTATTGLSIQGAYFTCRDSNIGGFNASGASLAFGKGITFGSNAYIDNFYDCSADNNAQQIFIPGSDTAKNFGAAINFWAGEFGATPGFVNGVVIGSATGQGPEVRFYGTSFDTTQIVINNSTVHFIGGHIEDDLTHIPAPFLKIFGSATYQGDWGEQVTLDDTILFTDQTPAGANSLIECDRFCALNINNIQDFATGAIPLVYMNQGGGTQSLNIYAPAENRTESEIFTLAPGGHARLNINTAKVHITSGPNLVIAGADLFSNSVVAYNGGVNFYTPAGPGKLTGYRIQSSPTGAATFCTIPPFTPTAYSNLGNEPAPCPTPAP